MKLYLLTRDEKTDWDTYDSAVVAAESPEDARSIHPDSDKFRQDPMRMNLDPWESRFPTWAKTPIKVKVKELGQAAPGVKRGVICASFNAG